MRHATLCKAVAVITLVSAAVQARALIIVPLFERGGIGTQFVLMVLVILALAIASIAGLWRPRWWGFVAFYGYAITSTLLLGSALINSARLSPCMLKTATSYFAYNKKSSTKASRAPKDIHYRDRRKSKAKQPIAQFASRKY